LVFNAERTQEFHLVAQLHGDHFTVGSTHEQMLLDAAQKAVIRYPS
jgi:hypothetical protein